MESDAIAEAYRQAGVTILEHQRREAGLPTLKDAGREPTWIESAARFYLAAYPRTQILYRRNE